MIVLIDQDNVLADFERGFREKWIASHPGMEPVAENERKSFHVRDDYPVELRSQVDAIIESPGFYRNLPPVPGAVAALHEILAADVKLFVCTSPLTRYENCVLEKYEWVKEHLGHEFTERIVLTRDKTLVCGDVLVDDKPAICGVRTPAWRHIIFDQPYNRQANGPRINWRNWRQALLPD